MVVDEGLYHAQRYRARAAVDVRCVHGRAAREDIVVTCLHTLVPRALVPSIQYTFFTAVAPVECSTMS